MSITLKRGTIAVTLIVILSILLCPGVAAQYSRGDKSFGVRAGYESRNNSAVAGLSFEYTLSRHVRLSPEIDIIFRHQNRDGGSFAINLDFPFQFRNDRAAFYPVAGLTYRSWGLHGKDTDLKDVITRRNSLGLNIGAGAEMMVSHGCKLSIEAIYTLQKHFPGVEILAGVSFVF